MTTRRAVQAIAGAALASGLYAGYQMTSAPVADPRTLPRADASAVVRGPSITYPSADGQGGDLAYGGGALGVSEDGSKLYIACGPPRRGVATLSVPQGGGKGTWIAPCQGPDEAEIKRIIPGWGAGEPRIGGVVEVNGRICVSAYGTYDANGVAEASHWCGPSLTQLSGPYRGTVSPGLVKGGQGVVPAEWRAVLGGPAFATAGYSSIISRASYGAALTVFDPARVTANNFPMAMLLGCPHSEPSCRTWTNWGPSTNGFEGAELDGGSFILPGTRTFVAIEREGTGTPAPGTTGPNMEGYGYATNNPALHGQPYPSPEGVRYIYSIADPQNQKGNKAYPYRTVAKLYDLSEFGVKAPHAIKQYATVDLPGPNGGDYVSGGAYNAVRGEFYLLRFASPGTVTVEVYTGWGSVGVPPPPPPPPPADVDCVGAWARVPGSELGCANGQRAYTEAFTVVTPASGNGAACPSPLTRTASELCEAPVDPCVAEPLGLRVHAWPRATIGSTAGRWTVTGPAGIQVAVRFSTAPQAAQATDSRGCTSPLVVR